MVFEQAAVSNYAELARQNVGAAFDNKRLTETEPEAKQRLKSVAGRSRRTVHRAGVSAAEKKHWWSICARLRI
jgi:hypothetical protein